MSDIPSTDWSETDASNNASPPNGWPEGMNPSDVNNTARADRGALKRWYSWSTPATTGGTTTAYTTTLDFRSSAPASIHVCFSPSGRAFVNQTGMFVPGAWAPLTDVLTATVAKDNREYKVVVLPNGTARLGL